MAPSHHQASQAISPVRDSPNREVQKTKTRDLRFRLRRTSPSLSTRHSRCAWLTVDAVSFAMGAPKTKVRSRTVSRCLPARAVLPSPSAPAPLPSRRDLPTNRRLVTHGTSDALTSRLPSRRSQWSSEEEDALRKGVEKYGSGKWRFIQKDARLSKILHQRSNVDLKVRRSPARNVPLSSGRSDEKKYAKRNATNGRRSARALRRPAAPSSHL